MVDFDSWFDKADTQGAGVVEKAKLLEYVQRMAKFEKSFTASQKLVTKDQIHKGHSNINKLVQLNKSNQLDYLAACSLVRKIYRCFDFDGDNQLDRIELQALFSNFTAAVEKQDPSLKAQALKDI